jgi:hypothetical protein
LPKLPADGPPDGGGSSGYGDPVFGPILATGTRVDSITESLVSAFAPVLPSRGPNGLQVTGLTFNANNDADASDSELNPTLTVLFTKAPVKVADTFLDVVGGGGAILTETATYGQDAALVKDTLGEFATLLKIGPYDAALVESSPYPGGFRAHSLFWSDGRLDFSLIVNGSSEEVVKSAQSMYCG